MPWRDVYLSGSRSEGSASHFSGQTWDSFVHQSGLAYAVADPVYVSWAHDRTSSP